MAWIFQAGTQQVQFGCGTSGLGLVAFPEIKTSMEAETRSIPRRDGTRMGVDLITGQTITLRVSARPDERPLDDVWRELATAWRGDEVRFRSGKLARLTADSGRTALGRPRPISPDFKYKLFGLSGAELVFECADDLWYGPAESSRVFFSVPETGGLRFPAEAPFTFDSGPTIRQGQLEVSGDVATWPVFVIHGPVTNPRVKITGVGELLFDVVLAYDQSLTVNTRDGWVKRDGVSLPGALSPRGARLSDMQLRPGRYEVVLGGYDPTGTGFLDVQVEPAFTSF